MKFGLFFEHQLPRPWEPGDERRILHQALEQAALADQLGFDHIWVVEHHFLEEYSHSSAPEVFLGAASQRTSRIRLGHGIVQLPPGFNHPARVAERAATLDLLCDGRLELGTGESSSTAELAGFGVDRDTKRAQWDDALDAICRMMVEEPFAGWDSEFFTMPVRNVIPKPLQRPHPPLWMACSRRDSIGVAARKGLGALSFSFIEPSEAKVWVDDYYDIIASPYCQPAGFALNPQVACVLPFLCHRDEEAALRRGLDGGQFFGFSLAYYYQFGHHEPGVTNVWDEFAQHRRRWGFNGPSATRGQPIGVGMVDGIGSLRGAIGTPEQVAALCREYESAGVDQLIFVSQAGRNRHEHICEALELFATQVMPEFVAREPNHQVAKQLRLSGATADALARKAPPRPAARHVIRATTARGPSPAPPKPGRVAQTAVAQIAAVLPTS